MFFKLLSVMELQDILDRVPALGQEEIDLAGALGRVLSQDILSPEDLPPFSRSTMDGYAVRASDTFGASESEPALLSLTGSVDMGSMPEGISLEPGTACRIWTGGALPSGADAVVMQEYVTAMDEDTIEVFRAVAPFENIIQRGDDVTAGETVLDAETRLRPQELGLLAGLGITRVPVYRKPLVAVISTGDELIPPDEQPKPGQIRDINTTTLSALCHETGAEVLPLGIARDAQGELKALCNKALKKGADVILVSGGSSVGRRDFTLDVFKALPDSRVLAHGVAVKPGKPTIVAVSQDKIFFGLPGHVASAIVVFHLFIRRVLLSLGGQRQSIDLPRARARLKRNISSSPGRQEYVRVRIEKDRENILWAEPVFGKSGLITSLVRADGLLVIPRDCEGMDQGETAEVMLFQ